MEAAVEAGDRNRIAPAHRYVGSADDIFYGKGWYELADDEALVIESALPADTPEVSAAQRNSGTFFAGFRSAARQSGRNVPNSTASLVRR